MMPDYDRQIDTSGLNCPLPILRTKKALASMASGQTLSVIATDPGSVPDFKAYARQPGNELLGADEQDGRYLFLLRKA